MGIVITGQNNTGKTFVTTLIYSLYNQRYKVPSTKLTDIDTVNHENKILMELDLLQYFEINKELIRKEIITTVKKNLSLDFATAKSKFETFEVDILFNNYFKKEIRDVSISEVRSFQNIDSIDIQVEVIKQLNSSLISFEIEQVEENIDGIDEFIKGVLIDSVFRILFQKTFFIPAERQGISLFSNELTYIRKKLFDLILEVDTKTSNDLIKFTKTNFNRYPTPIIDNINFLEELSFKNSKRSSKFINSIVAFEKEVLDGSISISDEGAIKFSTNNILVDINSMSSTVKSLSSLIVYLKHVIGKREFIIIDEPELNLHPDNQIAVIRFLVLLINSGVKLLISTHSEYMIRELNNLILLKSALKDNKEEVTELLTKYSYKKEELLNFTSVGAYLFYKKGKIQNLKVDNTGFEIETIDRASDRINEISNDIYFNFF